MTMLTRWAVSDPGVTLLTTEDPREIAAELNRFGIRFEQWPAIDELGPTPTQDEVLAAYKPSIDALVAESGYSTIDVAQIHPSDDPGWTEVATGARNKFLSEHTHAEDEIRFFVHGSGVFYLHLEDTTNDASTTDQAGTNQVGTNQVLAVLCEAGDLISVPALTTHWFDMGTRPDFTAIRFFQNPDGWVGTFTGNPIAESFATYDTLAASRAG